MLKLWYIYIGNAWEPQIICKYIETVFINFIWLDEQAKMSDANNFISI